MLGNLAEAYYWTPVSGAGGSYISLSDNSGGKALKMNPRELKASARSVFTMQCSETPPKRISGPSARSIWIPAIRMFC